MPYFDRIYLRIVSIISQIFSNPIMWLLRVKHGKLLKLAGLPIISKYKKSEIVLGDRVVLYSDSIATALGVNHPVILRTLTSQAKIEIGDDVGISVGTICAGKYVKIGARSMLGANVMIADTDFHDFSQEDRRYSGIPKDDLFAPVIIDENVFLGANVIVLKGVKVGKNSVIGAGSIVTHNIPENVIAAGNPCRVIKPL